jgi:hypothetical protein
MVFFNAPLFILFSEPPQDSVAPPNRKVRAHAVLQLLAGVLKKIEWAAFQSGEIDAPRLPNRYRTSGEPPISSLLP